MSLEIIEASAGLDQCYLLSLAWTAVGRRTRRILPIPIVQLGWRLASTQRRWHRRPSYQVYWVMWK